MPSTQAQELSKQYYIGESTQTTSAGVVRHPYLLARTIDFSNLSISDSIIYFSEGSFIETSNKLKLKGNRFSLVEKNGLYFGLGEFTGEPWKWTFRRLEIHLPEENIRIVEYSFMSDPKVIMIHRDYFLKNKREGTESLPKQEDIVLHLSTEQEFEANKRVTTLH